MLTFNDLPQAVEDLKQQLDRIEAMLDNSAITATSANEELIGIKECAALLKMASSSLYVLTGAGLIPHFKPSKAIVFKRSEVMEWLEKKRVKTKEQIAQEVEEHLTRK